MMKRYLVRRESEYRYCGEADLGRWIPLSAANEENTFATKAAAYEAIGREVERLVRSGKYTDAERGSFTNFVVVELVNAGWTLAS